MNNTLSTVSLRQGALYVPETFAANAGNTMSETTSVLIANAAKLGFTFSEPLLHALHGAAPIFKLQVLEALKTVSGVNKNWTPLVKGWNVATGERFSDHVMTFVANAFKAKGTSLPCGHIIPANTFPLERYNGCPFCGTPFLYGDIEMYGQGSKLKVLELWQDADLQSFYNDLLQSKTALDATQADSLKILLQHLPLPAVAVGIKETLMLVIDALKDHGRADEAATLFCSPTDILRYLWYKKTGFLQLLTPKTIVKRAANSNAHVYGPLNRSAKAALDAKLNLKLKYSRKECLAVATWLNNMTMDAEKACELMHAKRSMWVRFIRALRLPEYARRKGFEPLQHLLDVFYNQTYTVWQGKVDHYRLRYNAAETFALLKQRPGLFARSLFANMLWFGAEDTINAFSAVADQVPARLLFTLNMYAQNYFDPAVQRSVKPLGGHNTRVAANRLLKLYDSAQLSAMKASVEQLCMDTMYYRFALQPNSNKTMYIEPALYHMPVAIGDRSETIQDVPVALMGTRFQLEGNQVRLFMQWGEGMPAQHLDMDLSCHVAYPDRTDFCSYSNLVTTGCKHSGDIRSIPNKVGTAEYINIDVLALAAAGAGFVTFSCNAYSNGNITPNLVVGWMDSRYPMHLSEKTGVAYDPSCVQHQVRITKDAGKGLVFGVLDVAKREIVWLEMNFGGQMVQQLDYATVKALMAKLSCKLTVGTLLQLKAEAQTMTLTESPEADEVYDVSWARNAAGVTQLLTD